MAALRIADFTLDALKQAFKTQGVPAFRAAQVFDGLKQGIFDFERMKGLPAPLAEKLKGAFTAMSLKTVEIFESQIDDTCKYLFELSDGAIIEAVFMRYAHGCSVCISTQVGCKMGCTFCASYIGGFRRNLTSGEMLEQVLAIGAHQETRISNVVLMGSGEPLDNYDHVLVFLKQISSEELLGISMRHITVSTSGVVPKINALAEERLALTLAISLHAPTDTLRNQIMPINRTYPIDVLMKAAKHYADVTGRRITYEYALIEGFNDGAEQAKILSHLLKGQLCHVNLIPLNPVKERDYHAPTSQTVKNFMKILVSAGIPVSIRRELGGDIDAACGQLRNRYLEKTQPQQ